MVSLVSELLRRREEIEIPNVMTTYGSVTNYNYRLIQEIGQEYGASTISWSDNPYDFVDLEFRFAEEPTQEQLELAQKALPKGSKLTREYIGDLHLFSEGTHQVIAVVPVGRKGKKQYKADSMYAPTDNGFEASVRVDINEFQRFPRVRRTTDVIAGLYGYKVPETKES